jgi:hypothetical protein
VEEEEARQAVQQPAPEERNVAPQFPLCREASKVVLPRKAEADVVAGRLLPSHPA